MQIGASRDVAVSLSAGLNLLPVTWQPAAGTATCLGLLSALGGAEVLDSLARFDAVNQHWQHCEPNGTADFAIFAGEALAATALTDHSTMVNAEPACWDLVLTTGLNPRAHPAHGTDRSCGQWLQSLGPQAVTTIQRYDRPSARFESCSFSPSGDGSVVGIDFEIRADEGYLLYAPTDGVYQTTGCVD